MGLLRGVHVEPTALTAAAPRLAEQDTRVMRESIQEGVGIVCRNRANIGRRDQRASPALTQGITQTHLAGNSTLEAVCNAPTDGVRAAAIPDEGVCH